MLKFTVSGQTILRTEYSEVVADSKNYLKAEFSFSEEWAGSKTAVFSKGTAIYNVILDRDSCTVPHEVIKSPGFTVSVFGGDLITANRVEIPVSESGYIEGETPTPPTPDVYSQIISKMDETITETDENAQIASQKAQEASQSAASAKESELNSKDSETSSTQALTDLLAMMGTDIATLTGGKLTPSQIPDISINDVFEVEDVNGLTALSAQRGDVGLVMNGDVVSDSYILSADDASIPENWKKLGVSYVANAGHASVADTATNANMINNHRIVVMTQEQYDSAAIDPDTVYLVG